MEILGTIFGILIILAVIGGIVSLVIFLLPFLLGLVGIGIVVVVIFFVLFFVFQIIKAAFSKKEVLIDSEQIGNVISYEKNDEEITESYDEIEIEVDDIEFVDSSFTIDDKQNR